MGNRMSVILNSQSRRLTEQQSTISDGESINTTKRIRLGEDHSVETKEESDDEFFETKEVEHEDESASKSTEIEEFRKELAAKRELRRNILADRATEMCNLKNELESERRARKAAVAENSFLRNVLTDNSVNVPENSVGAEAGASSVNEDLVNTISQMEESLESLKQHNRRLRIDLTETILTLQSANTEIASLNKHSMDSTKHIDALKEVVAVSKKMLRIRESQLHELKEKLVEIEKTVGDKESCLLSESLRKEYERQLQNIRSLRALYEERARVAEATRLDLVRQLADKRTEHAAELDKSKLLTAKVEELENKVSDLNDTVGSAESQLAFSKAETKELRAEMVAINKLFTQMLMSNKRSPDLEKLSLRLEEHRELLTGLAGDERGEVCSALPKLLLDLLKQLEESEDGASEDTSTTEEDDSPGTSAEEIVGNLPKVWRVLIELLNHQAGPVAPTVDDKSTDECYKSVQTPSGPRMVPSVSKTYIRLKDLIVEKMSLVKETGRMKQLNSHLEHRLQGQERRLCAVTSELSKTWHIAGRLRRHHHQLHTHERILRYELQQKRKMINEIKEELRHCKQKWDEARQKNTDTEVEWKKLRTEFSSRKLKCSNDKVYNSPESGYSDEKASDDETSKEWNDESELVEDRLIRCRKKNRLNDFQDSSTDLNLVAEGEDPISDMLDVADLPLDSQDIEESPSVSCACDERGDRELADTEDISISDGESKMGSELPVDSSDIIVYPATKMTVSELDYQNSNNQDNETSSNIQELNEFIDNNLPMSPESISSDQNAPGISGDFVHRENSTSNELSDLEHHTGLHSGKIIHSVSITDEKKSTEPSISISTQAEASMNIHEPSNHDLVITLGTKDKCINISTDQNEISKHAIDCIQSAQLESELVNKTELVTVTDNLVSEEKVTAEEILGDDCNTSADKISIQNKRGISMTPASSSHSLSTGIHNIDNSDKDACNDSNEASTSSLSRGEVQEARWAARDERLKQLEEQTKNLVQKVNGTTSKSVKLQYKLEELHNIYGVEDNASRNEVTENAPEESQQEDIEKSTRDENNEKQNE